MSNKKREAIVALHAEGCTTKDIEKLLKVPIRTVQNVLKRIAILDQPTTDTEVAVRASRTPENIQKIKEGSWRKEERAE